MIYAIQCSCLSDQNKPSTYIGETERDLGTRLKEHTDAWLKRKPNSAFGAHGNCQPDFSNAKILAHQPHFRLRLLYESAFIRAVGQRETVIESPNDANVNRNSGLLFDQRWLPLVKDLGK